MDTIFFLLIVITVSQGMVMWRMAKDIEKQESRFNELFGIVKDQQSLLKDTVLKIKQVESVQNER